MVDGVESCIVAVDRPETGQQVCTSEQPGEWAVQQECRRLSDELTRLDSQLKSLAARLTNESFVSRAPQDVVAKEREKEKAWRDQRDVLAGKLKSLGCS